MNDVSQIPDDKLRVIVMAAVESTIKEGGYISITIVGQLAKINISKVPIEITGEDYTPK